jgi:sporulation protein YlmC with PRC-barrel domain
VVALMLGVPLGTASGQQPPPPQQQPSQQSPAASPSGQAGVMIASDSLLGTKVRDNQGREIGELSKLLIDTRQGKVTSAIIQQGGTLGMGAKEISVPWESLALQRGQNQQLIITMQQPMLEQAPSQQTGSDRQQSPAASPPASGQQERKQ